MRPRHVCLLSIAVVGACSSGTERQLEPPPKRGVDGVALVATPREALRACRRSALLQPACPARVPKAPFDPASEIYQAGVFPGPNGTRTFHVSWGGEYPRPQRNRPPALVHVVLVGGRPGGPFDGIDRPRARRAELRDGLLLRRRKRPLALGRPLWNGRQGSLVLAAPYPGGGINGNHLVFRWREGRRGYALSLHGWEPLTEAEETLRRMVAALPPGS
jgi:hypothetical protein